MRRDTCDSGPIVSPVWGQAVFCLSHYIHVAAGKIRQGGAAAGLYVKVLSHEAFYLFFDLNI